MSLDIYLVRPMSDHVGNVTHNLNKMAMEAGIYQHLWRPEEIGITHARQLIDPLRAATRDMLARPDHYRQFNPANGWGEYEGLVAFCRRVADSCEEHPDAEIEVSR